MPVKFDVKHWYHAVLLIGILGLMAGLTVEPRGMTSAELIRLALGLTLIGLGEWMQS